MYTYIDAFSWYKIKLFPKIITDRDGAIVLVTLNLEQFKLVRTMMVDSGYTGQNFANEISSLTSAKVIVVKRNELHQFSVIPPTVAH